MRSVLLAVCVLGCSKKPETPTEEGKEPRAPTQAEDDVAHDRGAPVDSYGSTTVDHGDGSYSYVLPPDFDPTAVVIEGPHTWSYAGQASFSYIPERTDEETYVAREDVPRTLSEKLLGTVRLDNAGRFWTITAVDAAGATARVNAAREASAEHGQEDDEEGTEPQ